MMVRYDPYLFDGRWFGLVVMVVLAIVFVLLVVWIVRRTDTGHPSGPAHGPYAPGGWPGAPPQIDPAIAILRERFARGEISEADYTSALRTLGGGPPS